MQERLSIQLALMYEGEVVPVLTELLTRQAAADLPQFWLLRSLLPWLRRLKVPNE